MSTTNYGPAPKRIKFVQPQLVFSEAKIQTKKFSDLNNLANGENLSQSSTLTQTKSLKRKLDDYLNVFDLDEAKKDQIHKVELANRRTEPQIGYSIVDYSIELTKDKSGRENIEHLDLNLSAEDFKESTDAEQTQLTAGNHDNTEGTKKSVAKKQKKRVSVFDSKLIKTFDEKGLFLQRGKADRGKVFCCYCKSEFFCTKYDIERHIMAESHKKLAQTDGLEKNNQGGHIDSYYESTIYARRAELIWAMVTAKKDLSFLLSNDINDAFKIMFPDSKIAKTFSVERRKTRDIITEKLGPFFDKQLLDILRNNIFSLSVDTSTDIENHNILVVNVTFLNEQETKVKTVSYRVLQNQDSTHKGLSSLIIQQLKKDNITKENIIALMMDGTAVMASPENGLYGEFSRFILAIFYIGCLTEKFGIECTRIRFN